MENFQMQDTKDNTSRSGNIIRLPSKKETYHKRRSFKYNFQSFCENTSLHGFHYITSTNTSVVERTIWSLVCFIFLMVAIGMMSIIMYRFTKTPTTTTIETTAYPIWEIEFPAITICNHNKVYLPSARSINKTMLEKGISQEDINNFFKLLPQLIRPSYQQGNVTYLPPILEAINKSMDTLMHELMQPCGKLLRSCIWLDDEYDCDKIFKTTKTSEGFCCSFNYHVGPKNFSQKDSTAKEKVNASTSEYEEFPGIDEILNVPGAGRDFGLIVHFDLESEYYISSIRPYIGASIMIHHPNEFPEVDLRSIIIQPAQEVTVLLSGTIIESEPAVQNLPVDLRNCVFEDERKLNISAIYSYQSCVSQCRIKFIVNICKCIPFYYPQIYSDVRTCELKDIKCLQAIRKNISELQTISDINAYDESWSEEESNCNCFPLCSDNWYTLNTESAYMESFHNNMMLINGLDIKKTSTAVIFFRDITCIKYKRDKWKSWNDLVASLGGILGLCVGGSFVSVVEVIYFFIINKCFKKEFEKPSSKCTINVKSSSNADHSRLENQKNIFSVEKKISPNVKANKTDEIHQCLPPE